MLRRLTRIGFILALVIGVSGCSSTQLLKHPITEGSRIGVIANFRSTALFQRAGTTTADNASFLRRISGLKMNALVTTTVANDLYRSRQYRVIPIYHAPANDLFTLKVAEKRNLTPAYKDFVDRLTRGKNLTTIVLITPGDIDFGDGQYFGNIWWVSGYGVFNRAFIFMQTNTVFAAYNVYVIDAKNYQVMAKSSGNLQERTHGIKIAWHRGYAGVTSRTLATVRNVIRKKMPSSLTRTVHKTGLP